jgi:hypothetical protein
LEKVEERGITSPGDRCGDFVARTIVLRTFVLATVAVPIVMYGLMPACINCGSGCSSAGPADDQEGRRQPVRADTMRSACPPSCRDG